MYSTTGQGVAWVTAGRINAFSQCTGEPAVRPIPCAHGRLGRSHRIISEFSVWCSESVLWRACSGAWLLPRTGLAPARVARLVRASPLGLVHSLRLIERLLFQRVHCCRLVSHFDNLLNSLLLSTRSSVIRHVDNLFSSSLLNTLRCVVVWSTNCCAAELLLLPLLWGLCRLFHICCRFAYLRNFAVCCSRRLHQCWLRKRRRVHFLATLSFCVSALFATVSLMSPC